MQVALYKGPGNFYDKLIRVVTRSKYSHCELVIRGISYSSSPRDEGVRCKHIDFKLEHWDFVDVNGDEAKALEWFSKHEGKPYDLWGAVKTTLPFVLNNKDAWFCSEAVAAMLGLEQPRKWQPKHFSRP
jgi:hypothetical protein